MVSYFSRPCFSVVRVFGLVVAYSGLALGAGSEIAGRVLDPQGKAVPGATVRLQGGGVDSNPVITDQNGEYQMRSIAPRCLPSDRGCARIPDRHPGRHRIARSGRDT